MTCNNVKHEFNASIRRRKLDLKRIISDVTITLCRYTIRFNIGEMSWLDVYLNSRL